MSITNTHFSRQNGLTLIELMISIALGLVVLSSLVFLIGSSMSSNAQQLKTTRLNQELRALMHLMVRDLRRAGGFAHAAEAIGFSTNHSLTLSAISGNGITIKASSDADFDSWVNAGVIIKAAHYDIQTGVVTNSCLQVTGRISDKELQGNNVACPGDSGSPPPVNPFLSSAISANAWIFMNPFGTGTNVITDTDPPTNIVEDAVLASYGCIMVGYDADKDGVADSDENYGFRRNGNDLQAWQSGDVGCNSGTWQNVSDEDAINITDFTITKLSEADAPLLELRISLAGELKNSPDVSRTIVEVVKLRNDPVL
jgi:prepilin-type N-terminal cleavage/methylation domain-containing protein